MPRTSLLLRLAPTLSIVLALGACVPVGAPSRGPTAAVPEREELRGGPVIEEVAVREARRDILGNVQYDLPVVANSWVEAELDFLVGQRASVIGRWLERGDEYEEWIKEVLRFHQVPTDLYHLAAIESGFMPTVRSRAGAVGMWQFMPATGRQMGLRVDSLVDERMDPVRATHAAARHLRSLHRTYSDWALAAAAYNAGTGRISRGMRAFDARDFWDLAQRGDLAEETRHYVPRLYAMTIIGRDRERFGLPSRSARGGFAFDSVHVEYATPLSELASLGNMDVEQLRRLNPHLLQGVTPAGGYWVWTPAGAGPAIQRAWLASAFRRQQGTATYTVRWGDSLGRIAQQSGVRAARIRELNPAVDFDRLQTGEKLTLPQQAVESLASRVVEPAPRDATATAAPAPTRAAAASAPQPGAAPQPASASRTASPASAPAAPATPASNGGAYASHVVESGETLWGIARQYRVEIAELQAENSLNGPTIRAGQRLRIPHPAAAAVQPVEHVVQRGDSLWELARRYGTTIDAIQTANALGSRPIVPGQKLTIPAPQNAQ